MRAHIRAGQAFVRQAKRSLSERDLFILRSVQRFRYMTTSQIEALHFYGHASPLTAARTCRRVLERLTHLGALARLERRIGGVRAGSISFVYRLAPLGSRILNDTDSTRGHVREPSIVFLDHTLAVAQVAVDLQVMERTDAIRLISLETEPECWRSFSRGLAGTEVLKPDLYLALAAGEYDYHWYVEVDRSSHSAASVLRKCRLYQEYWRTGLDQDRVGLFPMVLLAAATPRRADLLRRAISASSNLNSKLFMVATLGQATTVMTGGTP